MVTDYYYYLYVNDSVACKVLFPDTLQDLECIITIEITLKKRKWLLIGLYKPPHLNPIRPG